MKLGSNAATMGLLLWVAGCGKPLAGSPDASPDGDVDVDTDGDADTDTDTDGDTDGDGGVDAGPDASDDAGVDADGDGDGCVKWFPGHYAKANSGGSVGINEWSIAPVRDDPNFVGYTLRIQWSAIEVSEGVYDFSVIEEALAICERDGKVLMLTFADVNHSGINPYLPDYIRTPAYEGGYYNVVRPTDSGALVTKGYPRGWVPELRERWQAYITAVGVAFDSHPLLAAVTFSESSRPRPDPEDGATFTIEGQILYFEGQNAAAVGAFPTTPVMQYLNYLPGSTSEQREDLIEHIVETLGAGFGGPDLINWDRGSHVLVTNQWSPYYPVYRNVAPVSVEAQHGAFQGGSARDTFEYGVDEVQLNFLPWATGVRGPADGAYTIYDVIEVVDAEGGRINTTVPSGLGRVCR